jgi:hypothetical protein
MPNLLFFNVKGGGGAPLISYSLKTKYINTKIKIIDQKLSLPFKFFFLQLSLSSLNFQGLKCNNNEV